MVANLPNDEQLTEFLISVIPGHHMQSFGMTMLWAKTCVDIPTLFEPKEKLECIANENDDDSIWVISTPAKSGAVLRYVAHIGILFLFTSLLIQKGKQTTLFDHSKLINCMQQ